MKISGGDSGRGRKRLETVCDHVTHSLGSAFEHPGDEERGGGASYQAITCPDSRKDHDVHGARLVLKGEKRDATRGARALSVRH